MNKYLMIGTAALLASASPALASGKSKSHTINFNGSGGSYCDYLTFAQAGHHVASGQHLNEDCAGAIGQMIGTVDKKAFHLTENYSSYSALYDISKPIRNGGSYDLWICYNGSSCFEAGGGLYNLGPPPQGSARTSTAAKLAELLSARRAAHDRRGQ